LLKFWKQFHTSRHITMTRGKMLGRRNIQPSLNFSSIEKWQTFSISQSLSETFVFAFYAQYLTFWEQWSKEILSHLLESIEVDVSFYGHHWEEPCLTQVKSLKGISISNARFDSVRNSSPNPHLNCKIWIWNKAFFNREDQSIHLYTALWKDRSVLW